MMTANYLEKEFCFCTLAIGKIYRLMAQKLASNLQDFSPDTCLVVGTDGVDDFKNYTNVIAFSHHQTGILKCYHDKRFVIDKALAKFKSAIFIDSDTKITGPIPKSLTFSPGVTTKNSNLIEHISKYKNQNLETFIILARKLNIKVENVKWLGDSLFTVTRDNGKEKDFLETWGVIASYLELKGIHSGVGRVMGLAAEKTGLNVENNQSWESVKQNIQHLDASDRKCKRTFKDALKQRIGYHYRLNKARIYALHDFDFYYC